MGFMENKNFVDIRAASGAAYRESANGSRTKYLLEFHIGDFFSSKEPAFQGWAVVCPEFQDGNTEVGQILLMAKVFIGDDE
jgi:hypothetical protein